MANIPADQAKVLALRAEYPILDQQWVADSGVS